MEDLAHLHAASGELGSRGLDVGHDQVQSLDGPDGAWSKPEPIVIEQADPGGVICTTRKPSPGSYRHPVEARLLQVERLRAIHIRDGHDHESSDQSTLSPLSCRVRPLTTPAHGELIGRSSVRGDAHDVALSVGEDAELRIGSMSSPVRRSRKGTGHGELEGRR